MLVDRRADMSLCGLSLESVLWHLHLWCPQTYISNTSAGSAVGPHLFLSAGPAVLIYRQPLSACTVFLESKRRVCLAGEVTGESLSSPFASLFSPFLFLFFYESSRSIAGVNPHRSSFSAPTESLLANASLSSSARLTITKVTNPRNRVSTSLKHTHTQKSLICTHRDLRLEAWLHIL